MKGFKISPIHLPPVHKVRIKKRHYRLVLLVGSTAIVVVHYYAPNYEAHLGWALNILFIIDPTAEV